MCVLYAYTVYTVCTLYMLYYYNLCTTLYTHTQELLGGAQKEELHSVIVVQKTLSMLTGVRKQSSNIVALGNLRGTPVVSGVVGS